MDMKSVGSMGQNYVQPAAPQAAKKQEQTTEPQDQVSIGSKVGSFAKKTAKVVTGTALGLVVGVSNAVSKGTESSSVAALKGLDIQEVKKDQGFLRTAGQLVLAGAPVVGTVMALMAGAGPVGALIAGMMLPGTIGGTVAGINGMIDGAADGLKFSLDVGDKAQAKVAPKLGNIAGVAAKFTTSVALGIVMTPFSALLGGIHKGIDFAEKAIGVNKEPKNAGETVDSLVKEGAVIYGGISGLMASSGIVGISTGVGSSAGAIATGVAGFNGAINGFADGAKQGYDAAGRLIDKITK